jgi:hypothetical protein
MDEVVMQSLKIATRKGPRRQNFDTVSFLAEPQVAHGQGVSGA